MKKAVKVLRWTLTILFLFFALAAAGESDYADALGKDSGWMTTALAVVSGIACLMATAFDLSMNEND